MGGVGTHSQLPPTPIRVPGWMLILVTVRHGPSSLHRHQNTKFGGVRNRCFPTPARHMFTRDTECTFITRTGWGDLMS